MGLSYPLTFLPQFIIKIEIYFNMQSCMRFRGIPIYFKDIKYPCNKYLVQTRFCTERECTMLLIFYVALLLCASVHCDDVPTDAEVDAAFQKVEEALNDRKEIKSMIKDVKASMTKTPDYKKSALGIAKAVSSAVPKLMSNDGYTIAEGALTLVAGIAENIPGGTIIASVATLIASIIGIINTDKVGTWQI